MNYFKIYNNIIERSKNRELLANFEIHHIVPRCMGGNSDENNLARLTPEEHYVAHQLLVKIYPDNKKLIYAAVMMSRSTDRLVRNNKMYGWIKRALSNARKGVPKTAEHKRKISETNTGRKLSNETRSKMSVSRVGNVNGRGNKGVAKPVRTHDHIINLGNALRKPKSEHGRKNIAAGGLKRSIRCILEKRILYTSFFKMLDQGVSKNIIKETHGIKERCYYGIISKRDSIEHILRTH